MSTDAFLHALATALIDAIPLKCSLCRETSSGLGSTRTGTTGGWYVALFASDANTLGCKSGTVLDLHSYAEVDRFRGIYSTDSIRLSSKDVALAQDQDKRTFCLSYIKKIL